MPSPPHASSSSLFHWCRVARKAIAQSAVLARPSVISAAEMLRSIKRRCEWTTHIRAPPSPRSYDVQRKRTVPPRPRSRMPRPARATAYGTSPAAGIAGRPAARAAVPPVRS
eukprot:scaffold131032_cov40-Phaeocystis_antarctica.AAC.3